MIDIEEFGRLAIHAVSNLFPRVLVSSHSPLNSDLGNQAQGFSGFGEHFPICVLHFQLR